MVWGPEMFPNGEIRVEATLLDNSVVFWTEKNSAMAMDEVCGVNVSGVTEKGFLEVVGTFGSIEKRTAIGMEISYVDYLIIAGPALL